MGNNHRFKLSELIPNAWFYKLKDMGKKSKKKQAETTQPNTTVSPSPIKRHHSVPTTLTARSPPPPLPRRTSHHSRPLQNQKSRLLRHHRDTNPPLELSTTSGDSTATGTGSFSPEFRSDQVLLPEDSLETSCPSPYTCVTPPQPPRRLLELRPINTKPANKPTTVRKTAVSSPATGVRLRLRSPRISTRKSVSSSTRRTGSAAGATARRSRAVVKASVDPRKDFKESMEEMIVENNIRTSKDLEELLACYLCLNSDQYHNIIINVFKQIWLDLNLNLPPHHI